MVGKKRTAAGSKKVASVFSPEERAAMREAVRERKAHATAEMGELEVRAKIAEMVGSDRVIGERLHALIKSTAPTLTARTWYGMPAYARDEKIVCFYQHSQKFKVRYSTLGFSDEAKLDEGHMWPTTYALTDMGPAEVARVVALLKKALA